MFSALWDWKNVFFDRSSIFLMVNGIFVSLNTYAPRSFTYEVWFVWVTMGIGAIVPSKSNVQTLFYIITEKHFQLEPSSTVVVDWEYVFIFLWQLYVCIYTLELPIIVEWQWQNNLNLFFLLFSFILLLFIQASTEIFPFLAIQLMHWKEFNLVQIGNER